MTWSDIPPAAAAAPGSTPGGPAPSESAAGPSPDGATPGAPPPGDDPPDAAALQDQVVRDRLGQADPSWSADQTDRWAYDFLGFLAEIEGLTAAALVRYLDWLIARLKEAGHKPQTRTAYHRTWKTIARERAAQRQAARNAEHATQGAAGATPPRFSTRLVGIANLFADPSECPPAEGIFDEMHGEFLTNFTLAVEEEVEVHDGHEGRRTHFHCRLAVFGRVRPFVINARDFSDDGKLRAAVQEAAGSRGILHGKPAALREAVSALSWAGDKKPRRRSVTTDFGWAPDGTSYRWPGGAVSAAGFRPDGASEEPSVDLADEELAQRLGLLPPPDPAELQRLKRHVVQDLLQLHDRRVTYGLLAAVAAAVLGRFAPDADPFVLWLIGLTGAGKSFLARLFASFFGDFPVASGRFAAWTSTSNFLQRQGYFFKDALYLIDDYKPEVVPQWQAVRLLQNYADRTGRGRLKVDATTNTTRPIRGLLVSTGEDLPEHSASALARGVVVRVPQRAKDLVLGERCIAESKHYRAVTPDFIRWLLAEGRTTGFAERLRCRRRRYHEDIDGRPNDSRIAGNFGYLAQAFEEAARYLSDVWPEAETETRRFQEEDLVALRDEMLGAVREQQPGEVFWEVLGSLIDHDVVVLNKSYSDKTKPVIGKSIPPAVDLYCISTDLALAAVNKCLREQGRTEVRATPAALLDELRREGRLLDAAGRPLASAGADPVTHQVRIVGSRRRCFFTSKALLGLEPAPTANGNVFAAMPSRRNGAVTAP